MADEIEYRTLFATAPFAPEKVVHFFDGSAISSCIVPLAHRAKHLKNWLDRRFNFPISVVPMAFNTINASRKFHVSSPQARAVLEPRVP